MIDRGFFQFNPRYLQLKQLWQRARGNHEQRRTEGQRIVFRSSSNVWIMRGVARAHGEPLFPGIMKEDVQLREYEHKGTGTENNGWPDHIRPLLRRRNAW
ncbi:hypothetical protein QEV83_08770 [Methylocapsa sp. D3K7]|uniref:hypothetical protein n=1 Tax=Methylocapsa sp. D3K7 TaxID=3041435 RepID=UPI00244EBA12|nr:hypothetical protein [Methylocapsa sp. D3K7]WGJ16313.1 hypothetical protein QEV83_08770 [Methylocapsa sp. D3K7]